MIVDGRDDSLLLPPSKDEVKNNSTSVLGLGAPVATNQIKTFELRDEERAFSECLSGGSFSFQKRSRRTDERKHQTRNV